MFGFLLLLSVVAINAHTLTFVVEPKKQACFYEELKEDESFEAKFEVTRGGLLDIKLSVRGPGQSDVIMDKLTFFNKQNEEEIEEEGQISFESSGKGRYEICFDNRMSRWTQKTVEFTVDFASQDHKNEHEEIAKLTDLGSVVDSVINIADRLDEIEDLQWELRKRETKHRDFLEQNNARVQWLSMLEAGLVFSVSVFQLFYIRNWFSDTKQGRV